jgi:RimJ/RimL family protein N-acetyltransferase
MNQRRKEQPILKTARLILRPFTKDDADMVTRLAGNREVATVTRNLPYPYPPGLAAEWIASHSDLFLGDKQVIYAITDSESDKLYGSIGLVLDEMSRRGELGYWLGKPYWRGGYATEAAEELVRYGFLQRKLNRIFSMIFKSNDASRRVLEKMNFSLEGCLRQHHYRFGSFEDVEVYSILNSEYASRATK